MDYTAKKISDRIYQIKDICGVYAYLVIGNEKACLIDTCNGFGNISKFVKEITDKPIEVILTHGHLDHICGSGYFDRVYMSYKDLEVYKIHQNKEFRFTFNKKYDFLSKIQMQEYIDVKNVNEIINLDDYKEFSLGNLTLEMIPVPGHTPGMTCVLIKEERTIIFGDACGVFVLLYDDYSSSVYEYRNSLIQLKKYEDAYDLILRNHGTGESRKDLLDNVINCCELILNNKDDKIPFTFAGVDLLVAKDFDKKTRCRKDGLEGNLAYRKDKI